MCPVGLKDSIPTNKNEGKGEKNYFHAQPPSWWHGCGLQHALAEEERQKKCLPVDYQLPSRVCIHHCCALLVSNYQAKYFFFFRWKEHPVKNQKFPRKTALRQVSVPLQLKEVLQFLKSFGFIFPFKQTGNLESKLISILKKKFWFCLGFKRSEASPNFQLAL